MKRRLEKLEDRIKDSRSQKLVFRTVYEDRSGDLAYETSRAVIVQGKPHQSWAMN